MDTPTTKDRVGGPEAKRRKVRKGTRSCWECKRRKVRCSFASNSDEVCVPCRRRRTVCVSQELPEELGQNDAKQEQTDRIERMEALLKQLGADLDAVPRVTGSRHVTTTPSTTGTTQGGRHKQLTEEPTYAHPLPTPSYSESTSTRSQHLGDVFPHPPSQVGPSARAMAMSMRADLSDSIQWDDLYKTKLAKVSQALHDAFPAPGDVHILCTTHKDAIIYVHQVLTRSHRDLESQGPETVAHLARIPDSNTHPVLMARWMLLFALFLQQTYPLDVLGLSECPKLLTARLKDAATCLVTTNEELFGSAESLECILLEAVFEKNRGHFRRAWLAIRRAMTAAQLMNLHRNNNLPIAKLDPNSSINPQYLWFRIIYMDRFVCLMLGLPAASLDIDVSVDMINDTPIGQLERTHTMVSKRILERDEADSTVDNFAMTETIDAELLAAAEKLPHQFWQPLDFSSFRKHDAHIFWETVRLANQVNHFNLLNHLHLPYLLDFKDPRYSSSKITCAHASREVLIRWMSFRRHNTLYVCCRIGDFFALRAGLTLCLAHLANHHNVKPLLSLRHQRLGDRSMVEQTLEIMERLATQIDDPLARESSDLLQRLLLVEADAAQGQVYSARKCLQDERTHEEDNSVFSIYIPYFGVLKLSPEGTFSKEGNQTQRLTTPLPGRNQHITNIGVLSTAQELPSVEFGQVPVDASAVFTYMCPENITGTSGPQMSADSTTNEIDLQNELFMPCPIAGVDDWAFQGVDAAFFDSVMRGMTGSMGYSNSNEVGEGLGGLNHT
jgi:hypothetical protein